MADNDNEPTAETITDATIKSLILENIMNQIKEGKGLAGGHGQYAKSTIGGSQDDHYTKPGVSIFPDKLIAELANEAIREARDRGKDAG